MEGALDGTGAEGIGIGEETGGEREGEGIGEGTEEVERGAEGELAGTEGLLFTAIGRAGEVWPTEVVGTGKARCGGA